jgi:uncharacterized membrane protein
VDGLGFASRDPLPWISLAIGIGGGVAALIYAIQSYDAMPDRVPVHFGPSGQPDGWAARSFGSVYVLPLMTIVMGIMVGGAAVLTDDRFWKLGVFYVNAVDPSWLVEKRFGFGYTLNFGNRAALLTMAVLMLALFALTIWAIASS